MSEPSHDIARRAAARLAGADDALKQLPQQVERVIAERSVGGSATPPPARTYDADTIINLASLLVAIAGLAYQIYSDLRKAAPVPSRDVVKRRLRVEVREKLDEDPDRRQREVEIVVEETFEYEASGS